MDTQKCIDVKYDSEEDLPELVEYSTGLPIRPPHVDTLIDWDNFFMN